MAGKGSRRFALRTRRIAAGVSNDEVVKIQRYLRRFGYLVAPVEAGCLDSATQAALATFQRRAALPATGVLDEPTADALEWPRCGTPEYAVSDPAGAGGTPECSYQAQFRTLTYAFVTGTPDVFGRDEQQAIRQAFATWQREIAIDFVEVGLANQPNFTIGWFSGDHGDGSAFDGTGNTLGHAFFPPACGGAHTGKCHFDAAEPWALQDGQSFDIETVALHQIGHLLGLSHAETPGAVMAPFYAGARRALTREDVARIRTLYGGRGPSIEVLVHLESAGDVIARENEFAGTRGQSRRLEGFQLQISPPVQNLSLRYMACLEGAGDVPFVSEGQFVGTRGQSRRLEGFAIELTGAAAKDYNVTYMAHLQGTGDTPTARNGQYCGSRGQSRRVEGLLVRIEPR